MITPDFAQLLEKSAVDPRVQLLLTKRTLTPAGGTINSKNSKIYDFLAALCVAHAPHSDLPHRLRILELSNHPFDVPISLGHRNHSDSVIWTSIWAVVGERWHTLTTTLALVESPDLRGASSQCRSLLNRLYPKVGAWHHRSIPHKPNGLDRSVEALASEVLAEQQALGLKAHLDQQLLEPEALVGPVRRRL